jgi:hypothetical protein
MRVDLVNALKENAGSAGFGGRHRLGKVLVAGKSPYQYVCWWALDCWCAV